METTGQKRVLSFEEFMEKGHEAEMDSTTSQEMPMMIHGDEPMGQEAGMDLEKEPQADDMALSMMNEPEEETGEEAPVENPENEEPTTDESAEFWSMD